MPEKNKEEFVKDTIKVGNSAGVLLPKRLLGSKVKISIVKKPLDIRKEVMKLLKNYLGDIRGVYIMNKEPPEVLAISGKSKKVIKDKVRLSIVPLKKVRRDLDKEKLREKLAKAETIMNKALLGKLKKEIREG